MPFVEILPNTAGQSGSTGTSSWYYSTAPPSQSVSAMPTPDQLRGRKAKQKAEAGIAASENFTKRDVAVQRHIAELEKVNYRDVVIKIPEKSNAKRPKSQNVRRILASQKTFANYLADDEAAAHEIRLAQASSSSSSAAMTAAAQASSSSAEATEAEESNIPLPYSKAVAPPPPTPAKNARHFCEICGYWGTIRCYRCETRVCSGECLTTHREARCTRAFI